MKNISILRTSRRKSTKPRRKKKTTQRCAIHLNGFLTSYHHIRKYCTFRCQFILLRKSVMVLMDLGVYL